MPRKPRCRLEPGVYHVLNRGINRGRVFEEAEDKTCFADLLKEYANRFRIPVLHWVVMSNHYHLVLDTGSPQDLTRFVWGLQRKYTARHHARRRAAGLDACGFLWQNRFKSTLVETDDYLLSCGRYVERNPLRAGLVEVPWDYPWSSARAYALGQNDALTSVETNTGYQSIGRDQDERQAEWRKFLQDSSSSTDEPLFRNGGIAIGTKDFQERVRLKKGRPAYGRKGKPKP